MSNIVVKQINGGPTGVINAIINGNFGINQRGVSGTVTLASGVYGHDRWKAGSGGCTYTFATVENVTTLTITAGTLIQVIEGLNLGSGTYTLSFAGTAQGKIGAGSFAGSGVTGAAVGGTNLNIEFNTGTVSLVQFEQGSVATPFERRPYGTELALCQRYYSKSYDVNVVPGSNAGYANAMQSTGTTSGSGFYGTAKLRFPVNMRSAPTISIWTYNGTAGQWHAGVYGQSEVAYSASTGDTNTVGFTVNMAGVNASFNVGYGAWAASAEL